MPGYNRTGPQGQGSMTGRRFGICRTPAYTPYPEDPTNKIAVLKEQTDSIRQTLDGINSRIRDLEKASKEV